MPGAKVEITRSEVGAWLLQSNPAEVFPAFEEMADRGLMAGQTFDYEWSMVPTYRVTLVEPGDLVVLWMVGQASRSYTPGVYVLGRVSQDPFAGWEVPDGDRRRHVKEVKAMGWTYQIDFRAYRLEQSVPSSMLKQDSLLATSEKFTGARSQGNPLYLTPLQTVALARHMPAKALSASGWGRKLKTSKYTKATV